MVRGISSFLVLILDRDTPQVHLIESLPDEEHKVILG
jgi:hypothetical protein